MVPLFQPPIFQAPPACRWHWVVPQPVSGVVLPTCLATPTIHTATVATAAAAAGYYYPMLVCQPQPPSIPTVMLPLPPPPPPHRAGLAIRVVLHGQRRPGQAPGFWALALDAAYAVAPTKAQLLRDVAAWAAQHGLLAPPPATATGGGRRWTASLYILRVDGSPAAGVVVDRGAGCVVVPADRLLRAMQLSSAEGPGEDGVGEALEEARAAGTRAVLVVDVDAEPAVGAAGPYGSPGTETETETAPAAAGAEETASEEAVSNGSTAEGA